MTKSEKIPLDYDSLPVAGDALQVISSICRTYHDNREDLLHHDRSQTFIKASASSVANCKNYRKHDDAVLESDAEAANLLSEWR